MDIRDEKRLFTNDYGSVFEYTDDTMDGRWHWAVIKVKNLPRMLAMEAGGNSTKDDYLPNNWVSGMILNG